MANDTPYVLYGIRKYRVTPLLATGAPSPGLAAYIMTEPQEMGVSGIYDEGEIAQLRGGDALLCEVMEDDYLLGVDLTLRNAKMTPEGTQIMVGGDWIEDAASPPVLIGWQAPLNNTAQPHFKLEVIVEVKTQDRPASNDGWITFTFPFCRARLADFASADRSFTTPSFAIQARQNPYDDARSVTWQQSAAQPF